MLRVATALPGRLGLGVGVYFKQGTQSHADPDNQAKDGCLWCGCSRGRRACLGRIDGCEGGACVCGGWCRQATAADPRASCISAAHASARLECGRVSRVFRRGKEHLTSMRELTCVINFATGVLETGGRGLRPHQHASVQPAIGFAERALEQWPYYFLKAEVQSLPADQHPSAQPVICPSSLV